MKRVVLRAILLLAFPGVAEAKEFSALAVCGSDRCERVAIAESPFLEERRQPAPARAFYRLELEVHGSPGAWIAYYEPKSRLAAFAEGMAAGMTWTRLDPGVAKAVEAAAAELRPFPRPPVLNAHIGSRTVSDHPQTWLRLFAVDGPRVSPRGGAEVIWFTSLTESPWTSFSLLYYPRNDVLQTGRGRFTKLPAGMAADVEAARPLGSGGGFPWAILAVPAGLAAAVLVIRRR